MASPVTPLESINLLVAYLQHCIRACQSCMATRSFLIISLAWQIAPFPLPLSKNPIVIKTNSLTCWRSSSTGCRFGYFVHPGHCNSRCAVCGCCRRRTRFNSGGIQASATPQPSHLVTSRQPVRHVYVTSVIRGEPKMSAAALLVYWLNWRTSGSTDIALPLFEGPNVNQTACVVAWKMHRSTCSAHASCAVLWGLWNQWAPTNCWLVGADYGGPCWHRYHNNPVSRLDLSSHVV